jgi:hypothetical protein
VSDFYIYIYFRPNGVPCYVGKGRGRRWRDHFRATRNPHLANIIKTAGGEIPVAKIHVGLSEAQAFQFEVALIKAIGRKPAGPLVNLTDGGEGPTGQKMSPQARALMSEQRRGKPKSPDHRAKLGSHP